jgi:hypothetical protein
MPSNSISAINHDKENVVDVLLIINWSMCMNEGKEGKLLSFG